MVWRGGSYQGVDISISSICPFTDKASGSPVYGEMRKVTSFCYDTDVEIKEKRLRAWKS